MPWHRAPAAPAAQEAPPWVHGSANVEGCRQACSGIRLLLLLMMLREAKLADVTPCPGHHVRRHACRGERVPAGNELCLRSMPRSWPNARSTKRDDRVTAIHSRSSLGFACQGQAYENRRLEGSHECYPIHPLDLLLRLLLSN